MDNCNFGWLRNVVWKRKVVKSQYFSPETNKHKNQKDELQDQSKNRMKTTLQH